MIKILSYEQIRAIDAYTIEHEPISSDALMERAATKCFARLKRFLGKHQKVLVICGPGNNGGDGLVIARLLAKGGKPVEVWLLHNLLESSADNQLNIKRLQKLPKAKIAIWDSPECQPAIDANTLVVDALFGTGLNRPLEGKAADLVQHINQSGATVISIDIPSGMFCDDNSKNNLSTIIRAHTTFTLQFPKLAFFLSETANYVGHWEVVDIHLHPKAIQDADASFFLTELQDITQLYKPRLKFSHKGNYGHALLLAGSEGKAGAAVLAAEAALRSGAGLLTAHTARRVLPIMQNCVPEAMARADSDDIIITQTGDLTGFHAIAFGPGTGTAIQTVNALKLLIQNSAIPLVIDADGLNILAQNPTWLAFLPFGSVLTPHPREFERLTEECNNSYQRLEKARDFAFRFGLIIVLKGALTAVVAPNKQVYFNTTGNPGMATAGSGDVLTGAILGWLAQGYPPLQAAIIGVYLHGLAGDLAANRLGMEGMIAGDLNFHLPKASKKLFHSLK